MKAGESTRGGNGDGGPGGPASSGRSGERYCGGQTVGRDRVVAAMAVACAALALFLDVGDFTARGELAVAAHDASACQCGEPQQTNQTHGALTSVRFEPPRNLTTRQILTIDISKPRTDGLADLLPRIDSEIIDGPTGGLRVNTLENLAARRVDPKAWIEVAQ